MQSTFGSCVVKLFSLFMILGIVGYSLLCLVYALPVEPMQNNVRESCEIFQSEGSYNQLVAGQYDSQLDNFTDALMLIEAAFESDHSPMVAAVLNERPSIPTETSTIGDLHAFYCDNVNLFDTLTYGRYWHGYEVFLKPLLCIFNYGQIRSIICCVEIGLVFCAVGLLVYRKSAKYLLPLAAMWIYLNPVALFMSLQFSNMFILTLVSFIVILTFEKRYALDRELWIIHFFVIGCLTSYFDFLTYPLITLGIPIAYLLSKYCFCLKDSIISLIKNSVAWGAGYAGFWAAKWIGGSIISGTNILTDAVKAVDNRISHVAVGGAVSFCDVVRQNYNVNGSFIMMTLIISVVIVICALLMKFKLEPKSITILLIGLLPLGWYAAVSYTHLTLPTIA